jgi:lipopolysaccharide/colanic/teichoic acid biosynthesis glycosyltransferase
MSSSDGTSQSQTRFSSPPQSIRPVPAWKRPFDIAGGVIGTLLGAPLLLAALLSVWLYDRRNPLYISERIGLGGRPFRFIKVRTMIPNASATHVDSTTADDPRVIPAGRWIRALKIDELPQFWHVVRGDMSLVGPRPNVARETALYTSEEHELLRVTPGVTDFASIVFSDLAQVLGGAADPNIAYNQLVRPWKSRLGLEYLRNVRLSRDLKLVVLTVTNVFARDWTLRRICADLRERGAPEELARFSLRREPLKPLPPPGADCIVQAR